jgi:hypothetical protein
MFEAMAACAARLAEARAKARRRDLVEGLETALPRGLTAEAIEEGALLSGRRARSRAALDPEIRRLIAGLLK